MVLKDTMIFNDAIQLILYQIDISRNSRVEKDRIINFLKRIVEGFFEEKFETNIENDTFGITEILKLIGDNYAKKRVQMPNASIPEIIDSLNKPDHCVENEEDKLAEMQRKLKTSRSRTSKVSAHPSGIPDLIPNPANFSEFPTIEKCKPDIENSMFLPVSDENSNVFYGPQQLYGFIRHIYCLYERLYKARNMISQTVLLELYDNQDKVPAMASEIYSKIFLRVIRSFIAGNVDSPKYEDLCRHYLGQQSYLLFTIETILNSVFFFINIDL